MQILLLGALLMAAALVSGCRAVTGPAQCPVVNTSLLEGSSEIFVPNISSYSNSLLLCKENHTFSVCQPIARIKNGTLKFYRSEYVAHFSVSKHDLMVIKSTRLLIGEYHLKNYLSENCLQHVFLDVLGTTQCPFVNISIPEGSSEIIVPNISSYSNSLLLCKKNHLSSVCQYIASSRNGSLTPDLRTYMAHFSILKHGLMVVNATRFLIGEYQLLHRRTEHCLQHFFLDVLASDSKPKHYGVIAAGILLVLMFFALWSIQRRGITAHPSTEVQNSINESLQPMPLETDETRINTPSRESGKAENGML